MLLLQHLARIPYPVRPSSLDTAKADALWNTVGNISISSPIQNVEQKIYISFVKRFLVTQWKSCDLWLLCLEALIIELSFRSIQKMSLGLFIHFQEIAPVTNQKHIVESNYEKSESSP